ncbi:hypothetical protein WS86_01095 [Burkholderia savannae]|nr:hypothetical protein WS86_01095 [Burkholderia savannae]
MRGGFRASRANRRNRVEARAGSRGIAAFGAALSYSRWQPQPQTQPQPQPQPQPQTQMQTQTQTQMQMEMEMQSQSQSRRAYLPICSRPGAQTNDANPSFTRRRADAAQMSLACPRDARRTATATRRVESPCNSRAWRA